MVQLSISWDTKFDRILVTIRNRRCCYLQVCCELLRPEILHYNTKTSTLSTRLCYLSGCYPMWRRYTKPYSILSYIYIYIYMPVPVAARAKVWVCGRSPTEIVGSNSTGDMDVCLSWVLCVVKWRSLRRADHSSRGVLPTVVHRLCDQETSWMRRPWPTVDCCAKTKNVYIYIYIHSYIVFLLRPCV